MQLTFLFLFLFQISFLERNRPIGAEAARNGETNQLLGPAGVPDGQPVLDKTHGRSGVAVDQAGSEGKRDPAGDGRTGLAFVAKDASELDSSAGTRGNPKPLS